MENSKKLVIITGASSGFGAALAKRLDKTGHKLLLLARRLDKLEELNLENAMCKKVDVTNVKEFTKAVEEAKNHFGLDVDCLINNAGVMLLGDIVEQDSAEWKKMFDVNVLALLNATQVVLGDMKKRQTGTIVNVSSIAGIKPFNAHAAYCGTKYAVKGINDTIRQEVASSNVRLISIEPGAAETELLGHTTSKDIVAGYEQWKSDMGGVITADDVARSIEFVYNQPQNVHIRELVITATKQVE